MQKTEINTPKVFWIDLFAGAGGTTTGIHLAGLKNVRVAGCINHDSVAIKSHSENHPDCMHLIEDVRAWHAIIKIRNLVRELRKKYPGCIINLWASLECTNFSNAKGGLPRDADSRTLPMALFMKWNAETHQYEIGDSYIQFINPDYIYIENVREFKAWGPLDENGKPVSRTRGTDYLKWRKAICNLGYTYDSKILNAADYGAHTSRQRYFAIFAKPHLPRIWPEPTHARKPINNGLLEPLKKWKPVREVLDLADIGHSIFDRKKPYSEKTLNRFLVGLQKFVTPDTPYFLTVYNGNSTAASVNMPCGTIPTHDRFNFAHVHYDYTTPAVSSVDAPAGTVTTVPKHRLMVCSWLLNPQYSNKGHSLEKPCFTLIARMDKRPPKIVYAIKGKLKYPITKKDSPMTVKIKTYMMEHGIYDVSARLLKIPELKLIQGFPANYILKGTQAQQKKFIGNSVETNMAKSLALSNVKAITHYHLKQAV